MTLSLIGTGSSHNNLLNSLTVSYPAGTTAGNCMVACIQTANGDHPAVYMGTITPDNWILAASVITGLNVTTIWIDPDCAGGETAVTVVTGSAANQQLNVQIYEFSGVVTVSPLDQTSTAVGGPAGSSFTSGTTGTTTNADEAWVGMVGGGLSTPFGINNPPGWSNLTQINNSVASAHAYTRMLSGYQIVSSAGTANYAGTFNTADPVYGAVVITLSGGGGLGPVTGTAALTASSSMTSAARITSAATLTAASSLQAVPAGHGTATLAASSSLTATASSIVSGTATLAAASSMSAATSVPLVTATWTGSFSVPAVVTQVPPAATQSLGIQVGNTAGDWMFAILSWHQATGYPAASFSVADDAHNQWEPLGAPDGTSDPFGTVRTSIWYAPAAKAATLVMCAPTGFVLSACALILDVSGIDPGVSEVAPVTESIDFTNSLDTLTSPAPGTSAFFLSSCAGDLNYAAVNVTEVGWTGLPQVTATNGSDDTTDLTMVTAFQTSPSAVNATWGSDPLADPQDLAGIVGGVLCVVAPPAQVNPAWPVVILEVAPGAGFATPPDEISWVPVASPPRFLTFSVTQGKQYELDQLQAAQGAMALDNPDGALIPPGTGAFAGIDSGTPLRLRMVWAGGNGYPANPVPWYVVFSGFFERWPQAWDTNTQRGITETTLVDGWAYCQAVLNSILRVEILADGPYAYWPLGDAQGATYASNIAQGNTNPLIQVVSRFGASTAVAAFGADGSAIPGDSTSTPYATGPSTSGFGTTGGTLWQQTGLPAAYSNFGYTLYCEDSAFPPMFNGLTIEGWFQLTDTTTFADSVLWVIKGSRGPVMQLYVDTSGFLQLSTWDVTGNLVTTVVDDSQSYLSPFPVFHTAVTWDGGVFGWSAYVNGTLLASSAFPPDLAPNFTWISADGQSDRFAAGGMFDGNVAHIAIFPLVLPVVRIATHYYAGATGLTQELSSSRVERLLAATGYTGRRMIEPAYAPYADECSSADDVGNQQAGTAISNIVSSTSPSVMYTAPTSDMTYHVKARTFSERVRWILGEYSAAPLNSNYSFSPAVAPWTGLGGALLSLSTAYAYQGLQCLLVTPPATATGAVGATSGTDTTFASPFVTYTASAWVMIPYGWPGVQVNLGWWSSAGASLGYADGPSDDIPAGMWTQVTFTAAAPASTAYAEMQIIMTGTPSPSILMFCDQAMITQGSLPGGEIPYQGSIAYDYDPTRVVNSIQITQLDRQDVVTPQVPELEQASARQYGTYTDYITGYLFNDATTSVQSSEPSNLIDLANWIAETNAVPSLRVSTVTVDAASNPQAWPLVLGISPGDMIIVNRRPPTAANLTITLVLRVTQVARNIQFSASDLAATVTLTVDACPEEFGLSADNAILGQLDAQNLLSW